MGLEKGAGLLSACSFLVAFFIQLSSFPVRSAYIEPLNTALFLAK